MRHNKMAGNSKFLLGKKLSDEKLTVSRKRKPSQLTFTNHLLHSKSTYFYRWFSKKSIEGHSFSNTTYLIPSVCGVALLCGIGLVFNPTISNGINSDNGISKALLGNSNGSAYAETVTSNPTDYSSISMALSNNGTELDNEDTVSTNVTPGLVNYIDNNIKISTSKIDRFYVTVQAAEDGTSELTGAAHGETIAPVGSNVSTNNFPDNSWGYALVSATNNNNDSISSNSLTYNSLPAYNTAITPQYTSAQELADGEYNLKLTFAAKINADKPSDHYTTKAMVSVAADAKYVTLLDIDRMQDMTSDICTNTANGASKQLIDDRSASGAGQKKYWIGKVNGQCIMTQNLDLDIPSTGLSKDDTDLNGDVDWNSSSSVQPVATLTSNMFSWGSSSSNYNDVQSYDPGEYIINNATGDSSSGGWTACDTTTDPTTCNRYTAINSNTPDASLHYAVGNYYSWETATAGTGAATAMGTAARDSICPKGWKLPDNSGDESFQAILSGKNQITIREEPTYFPAAGGVASSGLYNVGLYGYYWSSTRGYNNDAYALGFYAGGFYPQDHNYCYVGYSVRCVLK